MPLASVVVPASGKASIERCLRSLLSMDTEDFEVIVVTGRDSAYFHKDQRVLVVKQNGAGIPNARNCGIREARGKVIAFTEEGCVVSRQWLCSLMRPFEDPDVGGAGSISETYSRSKIARMCDASFITPGSLLKKYRYMREHDTYLSASSAAYRAEIIKGLAGFDESLPSGDDYDLSLRVKNSGFRLELVPEARVWHEGPSGIRDIFGRQRRLANGDVALARKYSKKATRLKLLAAIPFDSLASIPYALSGGMPALPAFVFFMRFCRLVGSLTASPR